MPKGIYPRKVPQERSTHERDELKDRRLRIPKTASEQEVYNLGLRMVKWFLTSSWTEVTLAQRLTAARVAVGLKEQSTGDETARKMEQDIERLVSRVFGEPMLRLVAGSETPAVEDAEVVPPDVGDGDED